MLTESLQATAIRELASTKCVCGGAKDRNHSFCRVCYHILPRELRVSLWQTSSKYASNYDEAKDWLRVNAGRGASVDAPQRGFNDVPFE